MTIKMFPPKKYQFRDLRVGDTFDFVSGERDSFFLRCEKTGPRTYKDEAGTAHRVGRVSVRVYHVALYD